MKKWITGFIILFSFIKIPAQSYHPIPTDSVYWIETSQGPYMGSLCIQTLYNYIYPVGSINILGQSYTEFHARTLIKYDWFGSFPNGCPPSDDLYPDHLYALIRNDSINKKVFIYDTMGTHNDILLYDFDISIGDTVPLLSGYGSSCPYDTFTVANIDSVDIGGEYRRSYEITTALGTWWPIYLIEGIGSNYGFAFNNYCPFEYTSQLLCYHYKQFEYGAVNSMFCSTTLNIENDIPNALSIIKAIGPGQFEIMNPQNEAIYISCYDMLGKFILERSLTESGYLDFSETSSGVYVMYIECNGQPLKPYKFVISH